MKYEVIGWTESGTSLYPRHQIITAAVDAAVIKEIVKNGYLFGGDAHEYYCPVLNDGTYVSYSWRGWGRIMALAHGVTGEYSYMFGYMDMCIKPKAIKKPRCDAINDKLIVPKETLVETFDMRLADDMFEAVKLGTKTVEIRLFDDKRKLVDIGDFIRFSKMSDPSQKIRRRVVDIELAENFENLFTENRYKEDKIWEKELRFTPVQLGAPENSTVEELVEGMRKFYTEEQEEKDGVIAFIMEKPNHTLRTRFLADMFSYESDILLDEKFSAPNISKKECESLLNAHYDYSAIEGVFQAVSEEITERSCKFFTDYNEEYDVDVNVMLRKTLKNLFGKEKQLKEIRDYYCIATYIEIFAVFTEDSEGPKPILSLDEDILKFLHETGAELKFDYYIFNETNRKIEIIKNPTCKTYFSIDFNIDEAKNAELLGKKRDCAPEEIGIFNKPEVEQYIKDIFGVTPKFNRRSFIIGLNETYDSDVNEMIRKTLNNLLGKEEQINTLKTKFSLTTSLEIVPYIATENPDRQYLSLDKDILEFLYDTGTIMDLDYYII